MSCYTVLQNAPNIIAINIGNEKAQSFGGKNSIGRGEFNSMYSSTQNLRKKRATSLFRLQSFRKKIAKYKLEQKK